MLNKYKNTDIQNKKYTLTVPSIKMITKNKDVYDTTSGIIKAGLMPSVFYTLMYKMTQDPNILSLKESSTDIKISRTISGLESIAQVLTSMQDEQVKLRTQLSESIELIKVLTDKLTHIEGQNTNQQKTIKDMLEILSSSAEGIEMLNKLTEKTSINLNDLVKDEVSDTKYLDEINEKVNELQDSRLQFQFGVNTTVVDDFDDDDDDLLDSDFTAEELSAIVSKFKSE